MQRSGWKQGDRPKRKLKQGQDTQSAQSPGQDFIRACQVVMVGTRRKKLHLLWGCRSRAKDSQVNLLRLQLHVRMTVPIFKGTIGNSEKTNLWTISHQLPKMDKVTYHKLKCGLPRHEYSYKKMNKVFSLHGWAWGLHEEKLKTFKLMLSKETHYNI